MGLEEKVLFETDEIDNHGIHKHSNELHVHKNSKAVANRLAKAIGHLESVKRMVERGDDCAEVLIQLVAVRSAINNTGKVILKDHLNTCIVDAIEQQDFDKISEFNDAIQMFIK